MEFVRVCNLFEQLSLTSKRLEKTQILADFIKLAKLEELSDLMLLFQGKVFLNKETKIGFSTQYVIKALKKSTGLDEQSLNNLWRDFGDLGDVAAKVVLKKTQSTLFSESLTLAKVLDNVRKLAVTEGIGSVSHKIGFVAELYSNAKPVEAKYISRLVLEDLRTGVGSGILRDSLVWAYKNHNLELHNNLSDEDREIYNVLASKVQEALDLSTDYGLIAKTLLVKGFEGLNDIKLTAGRPINVMLALKEENVTDAFKKVGRPAAIEYKLDGFRLQIHKDKTIRLFTRRLEDVTEQFPDVVEKVKNHVQADSFILDAEIIGFDKEGNYLPFQSISQRIKRKHDICNIAEKFPVEVNVFDVVLLHGNNFLKKPFEERRGALKSVVNERKGAVVLIPQIITDDEEIASKFYQESLDKGNEGVMFKTLNAVYKPGARTGFMIKLKPVMETLDVVIVGGEWGEGKRSSWVSSFMVAVRDEDDNLVEVGHVATGLKEKREEGLSFDELTVLLIPHIIKQKGRLIEVSPFLVLEVAYEEIQKSPKYASGFALRFPRIVTLREDRGVEDSSTMADIERLFVSQRSR